MLIIDRGWVPPAATGDGPSTIPAPPSGEVTVIARAQPSEALPSGRGTITGQVIAQSTLEPLPNVQVSIQDLNVGSLTAGNGRYLLIAVPVGTYEVTVTSIGYGVQTAQVTVGAEETVVADFELEVVALNLDEIVVTGTGAPTQRRRLGASIASVSSEELGAAPITNIADALIGRLPGARGLISGGQTGAGSQIILRGTASISQRQDPIIYVDVGCSPTRTYFYQ